jgi:phospholipid/cholesterol/gamma-HCH transport system substrate-binding protein
MGEKTKMFVPKGKLSLIMADVAGLKAGAPVWLAGVDVGVVTAIRFERPQVSNEVEIVMQIDRAALKKIGRDSVITVKTRGLMGEKYVDITPSQHYVSVPETRVYGTTMIKLDDVMQKAAVAFDRLNQTMNKVNQGQGTAGKLIADSRLYDNLVTLSEELNRFARAANRGDGTLGQLTKSREAYDKLMDTLARADETFTGLAKSEGTLNKLIYDPMLYDKLVQLADKSIRAADDVRELNRKLTSQESSIGKLLGDREFYDRGLALIDRADRSVKSFEEVANRVNRGEGTAGKLVSDKALYDRLNKMVDDMDLLLKDIKTHPKRYLKFSVF